MIPLQFAHTLSDLLSDDNTIIPVSARGTVVTLRVRQILRIPRILDAIKSDFDNTLPPPAKLLDMYYFDGCPRALHRIIDYIDSGMDVFLTTPQQYIKKTNLQITWWGIRWELIGANEGRLWVDYGGEMVLIHQDVAHAWLLPHQLDGIEVANVRSRKIFKNYDNVKCKMPTYVSNHTRTIPHSSPHRNPHSSPHRNPHSRDLRDCADDIPMYSLRYVSDRSYEQRETMHNVGPYARG